MDGMSQKHQGMSEVPFAALCAASNIERSNSLLDNDVTSMIMITDPLYANTLMRFI